MNLCFAEASLSASLLPQLSSQLNLASPDLVAPGGRNRCGVITQRPAALAPPSGLT